ncbi:TetR/AcrR family transcriptional regulator [Thermomonospora umbrina]|uniref:TetR family transcriptional regulator n=1 Tax=Thermomonospora umbrina TaxID=111806 RepID=A0A3D9T6H4_9ACTN|nr:TetR/AcrR family transcriptional regulator [Thermomonospora umbrina]REF00826.1 TetR family transcriptional regulator [Thermomonospora umbrina]
MARPAGPGREALLRAGLHVAQERGLTGMSVNAVVEAAGMSKGNFYQHFTDRRDFLRSIHRLYHDEMEERLIAVVGHLPPGRERLIQGIIAHLDLCLETRATRALLVQARTDADLFDEMRSRNDHIATLVVDDLAAVGWDPPEPVARMMVTMVGDVSLEELFDDRRRDDLRDALLRLLLREATH